MLTNAVSIANGVFTGGPGTTFGGPVNITAPSILLNGSTYNSTAILNKSGAQAVQSLGEGGNIGFDGVGVWLFAAFLIGSRRLTGMRK